MFKVENNREELKEALRKPDVTCLFGRDFKGMVNRVIAVYRNHAGQLIQISCEAYYLTNSITRQIEAEVKLGNPSFIRV